ncbi:MAG: hypothetical protein H6733_16880 [Alphaproteobacteria bacterium]|nr:hypothetical protein [Alphaproteobacteria bacterium]
MTDPADARRDQARRDTARDLARLRARPVDDGWARALRVLGSVGWPIALLTLLGAALGRVFDRPWLTAALISAGAAAGAAVALSGLRREAP